MRRFFTWSQKRLMEKQNPELASVMRKLERLGPSPDPRQTQQVISRFTRAEKRAYDEYLAVARDQGALPEAPNRQARRQQQRMQGSDRSRPAAARPRRPASAAAEPPRAALVRVALLERRGQRLRRSRRSPGSSGRPTPAMRRKPCTIPS